MKNKIFVFARLISIFCLISCTTKSLKDEYLYDKIGFAPGSAPKNKILPNINTIPPSYYFRNNYSVPASRYYSNPYAIPPSTVYQRYDADQYYVVPNAYQNVEKNY